MNEQNNNKETIQHSEQLKQHDMIITDHERRIRWLEKMAFYVCGALLVIKVVWDLYTNAKGK